MAIQQSITIFLTVQGDGSSTTFSFGFNQLYATSSGNTIINPSTVPSSVVVMGVDSSLPTCSASIDGFGNLVLTFNSAPGNGISGNVQIQLLFNSNTILSGTSTSWTSATALNTTWTLPLSGAGTVQLQILTSGIISGGVIEFLVSMDGTNWYTTMGMIPNSFQYLITNWTSISGTQIVQFDTYGFSYFRIQLTTVISGSGTVTPTIQSFYQAAPQMIVSGQPFGQYLHTTLDDAAGGNAVNTVTKGNQASRALGTQDLKDSGRTYISFTAIAIAGVTSEALISFTQNKQGVTTASVTSYTITSGKTFRITSISYSIKNAAAAIAFARLALRHNIAGTTTASSPVAYQCPEINTNSATSGTSGWITIPIPDGIEFFGNGTQTIGVSHLDQGTTNILNVTVNGFEY